MSGGSNLARRKFERLELIAADRELPPSAAHVAIVLLGFMGLQNRCAHPSVETIGERLGMSRRGVQVALSALVERGHLIRETGGGRRATSRYYLPSGPETAHGCAPFHASETAHTRAPLGSKTAHKRADKQRTPVRPNSEEGTLSDTNVSAGCARGVIDWEVKKRLLTVPQHLRHRARRNGLTDREMIAAWKWVEISRHPENRVSDDQAFDHFANEALRERGAA